jgi:hypothetical protein
VRLAWAHFRGDATRWLALDRELGDAIVARLRSDRPSFTFAAFTATDKTAHACGHDSAAALEALRIVDDVAARIRHDAERAGRWHDLSLWIASDHGHAPVGRHDELTATLRSLGIGVRAHPWMLPGGDVAIMVSGNAMAHLYLDRRRPRRPFWPALRDRWEDLAGALLARPAVDLLILPHSATCCEVRGASRGSAMITRRDERFSYLPVDGDPLGFGAVEGRCSVDALERTVESEYPDSIVQVASLAAGARCGDMIVSAAPGWDLRERYEPLAHRSSHGSLRREHMLVPLLLNRPARATPMRTADVMPSVLRALGIAIPRGLDGLPFR